MTSSFLSEDEGMCSLFDRICEIRALTIRVGSFGQNKRTSKGRAPSPKRESPSSSSNQRFFFVDAKSSSKGKRSHVMKHHIREKRKGQNKLLSGESSTQSPGRPNRILPWTRRAAQRISELEALTTPETSLAPSPSVVVSFYVSSTIIKNETNPLFRKRKAVVGRLWLLLYGPVVPPRWLLGPLHRVMLAHLDQIPLKPYPYMSPTKLNNLWTCGQQSWLTGQDRIPT